jgi:hypothetical protein
VISLVREDDHLFAQIDGQKNEIFPESVREYVFMALALRSLWGPNRNGRATELIVHEGVIK